ncbi:MAG TPA: hypothetical protein DG577_01710 [Firmicutes bacterium]|jgi:hypothetical protein|nr:hypothetical protein [Bacillota bacterium]HCX78108.1 hypothetical protein [Bacillota bacterium]
MAERFKITDVYVLVAVALLLSVALLINSLGFITLEVGEFHNARDYALSLLEFNRRLASDLEVPEDSTRVRFAYENLHKAIDNATTTEEITNLILSDMGAFEDTIREEADYYMTNWLEWVISQDPNLPKLTDSTEIIIHFLSDNAISLEGGDFLDFATVEKIRSHFSPKGIGMQTVTIAIDVDDDLIKTRVIEPLSELYPIQHMQNQYKFLEQEYNNLRSLTGYSELTGPGIVISLMDAEDELLFNENNIIHDVDVQEIVHSLFASGAIGISVGGKRLVVDTSIRCVGGPILVNYDPIPVKPLIIKAVGDAEAMNNYLSSLFQYYREKRNLRVEVSVESEIRLPGQSLR